MGSEVVFDTDVPTVAGLASAPGARAALADPTRAYLASLSPAGREAMVKRLRAVARLLPANGGAIPPWEAVPWHELRFQHVEFIRQRLTERGAAPATVNLTLAALRGIGPRQATERKVGLGAATGEECRPPAAPPGTPLRSFPWLVREPAVRGGRQRPAPVAEQLR